MDLELLNFVHQEPWLISLAQNKDLHWSDIEDIVDNFVLKYYAISREEVTTRFICDIVEAAKLCVTTPSN